MPSGKTHDIITIISLPIVGVISNFFIENNNLLVLFLFLYLFSSFMFNGDLDIISRPYRRWYVLRFIWVPYQKIFEHRSIWTHGILIGTIVRIIYISPLFYVISIFFSVNFFDIIGINHIFVIFLGLELGNSIHTISDKIF